MKLAVGIMEPGRFEEVPGTVLRLPALSMKDNIDLWSAREIHGAGTILGNSRIDRHAGAEYQPLRR